MKIQTGRAQSSQPGNPTKLGHAENLTSPPRPSIPRSPIPTAKSKFNPHRKNAIIRRVHRVRQMLSQNNTYLFLSSPEPFMESPRHTGLLLLRRAAALTARDKHKTNKCVYIYSPLLGSPCLVLDTIILRSMSPLVCIYISCVFAA